MTIKLITFCYNEMRIIPFVIDYWKHLGITHAYIFDDGSTDGSVEYLSQFDWITIFDYTALSNNSFNEDVRQELKNYSWKMPGFNMIDSDFTIICDIDECLYTVNPKDAFKYLKDNGYSILQPQTYIMTTINEPTHIPGKFYHEIYPQFKKNEGILEEHFKNKIIGIDESKIIATNYTIGSHDANPEGDVKVYDDHKYVFYNIHMSNPGLKYTILKYDRNKNRMSPESINNGYNVHYMVEHNDLIARLVNEYLGSENIEIFEKKF